MNIGRVFNVDSPYHLLVVEPDCYHGHKVGNSLDSIFTLKYIFFKIFLVVELFRCSYITLSIFRHYYFLCFKEFGIRLVSLFAIIHE